jgi:signal transduction histidine kinase
MPVIEKPPAIGPHTSYAPRSGENGAGERPSTVVKLRRSVVAHISIEHKLPLIIGVLLLAVTTAMAVAAHREAKNTAMSTASDRLTAVVTQLRDLFEQSGRQLHAVTSGMASNPAIVEYARTRNPARRDAATAALRDAGRANQAIASELRGANGAVLLTTAAATHRVDSIDVNPLLARVARSDSTAIGRFRILRDTIIYPVAAPVAGVREAYVVHWRRIAGSRRSRETITQLIGSEASIFLGNLNGDRWTDLERHVPAPPIDTASRNIIQSYRRGANQARYLAAVANVSGTPWVVAVDFPYSAMLSSVESFRERMTGIATLALALGVFAGWILSRQITAPLLKLTDAAVAVAAGDYSRPVHVGSSDELGRLGKAFTTMAIEVRSSRDDLERKVADRTRDLNKTLAQLHEAQDSLVRREKLALLGQLAGGVGHELRNPLGVMTNAVYYLKTVLHSSPFNVHEYLQILQQQITLSEKIIGDLLDFARSRPPKRNAAHLTDIVEGQLARIGATPGVVIETEVPKLLPTVLVDATQIGQILLNLITNAVQSIDGKGGRILIRASTSGDYVECEVIDTGPGIPPDNLEKIFEPLFTTKARGIGLGLAVSRQLARANSGDLTVWSKVGQGAVFKLLLPVTAEA